jgi:hypothetical protein
MKKRLGRKTNYGQALVKEFYMADKLIFVVTCLETKTVVVY